MQQTSAPLTITYGSPDYRASFTIDRGDISRVIFASTDNPEPVCISRESADSIILWMLERGYERLP